MTSSNNKYCLILAGGKGRRLWPVSRDKRPKQFIDFFGTGRTQLQQTFDRFLKIIPQENIFINTSKPYLDQIREQLPEVELENIMVEPIHRNTAPSVAWGAFRIGRINPDATLIVTPSDQNIFNEDAFDKNVMDGLDFVARNDCLLTMGIKPTRAEPGYGYIQEGALSEINGISKVKAFTEKPNREFAKMFMESGEWYWNTGLFLSNVHYLIECLYKFLPDFLRKLKSKQNEVTIEEENEFVRQNFPSFPNISIDYGVLEKSDNVFLMKCNFGWADFGTWHGIYEAVARNHEDNVVIDSNVMLENSKNNIIKLSGEKLAVINGLEGFIVAEEDNVLLICRKEDSSALIRKYINEVQMKHGDNFV